MPTDEEIAKFRDKMDRLSSRTDMVAVYRDADMVVYAERCPKCGRWAHAEAGNNSAGKYYWMITDCAKCGRYECRGGPAGFQYYGRKIKVKKLDEQKES